MDNKSEEKCLFEIKSGMYGDPLMTKGTVTTEGNRTVYNWTEKHNEKPVSEGYHDRRPDAESAGAPGFFVISAAEAS